MDGELRRDLQAAGVEVLVRPLAVLRRAAMSPAGLARVAGSLARDGGGLARLARRRDVALVHTNTSVTLGGAAASRLARIPHVWHLREIFTGFERFWPAYRRLLLSADALPCVSQATCAQLGGDQRAVVVHDGLAIPPARTPRDIARAALDLPPDAFVCAILGRISTWKGQDVLIEALADPALAPSAAIALVAGDPWQGEEDRLEQLRALAARLGVTDRVRFCGFRPDVENVYGAADVVCVPSTQPDPLPNAALEAAAAGCCVVAADHGGLPEILRDGVTGLLVAPGDPSALAAALARLRSDPAQRERLGAAAAADVRARFDPAKLLAQTQELYDKVSTATSRQGHWTVDSALASPQGMLRILEQDIPGISARVNALSRGQRRRLAQAAAQLAVRISPVDDPRLSCALAALHAERVGPEVRERLQTLVDELDDKAAALQSELDDILESDSTPTRGPELTASYGRLFAQARACEALLAALDADLDEALAGALYEANAALDHAPAAIGALVEAVIAGVHDPVASAVRATASG